MSGKVFFDTNVLLYAHDAVEVAKRPVALALYKELLANEQLVVSTQVLGEFFVNAIRDRSKKGKRAIATWDDAERVVTGLAGGDCYSTSPADYVRAIGVAAKHQVGFWDSLIVVAASRAGCERLLSEDFKHGRTIEGVRVENPFLAIAASDSDKD
jgi:predicted nucleic acid-binding protein